jgi:mycofactocin system glycosyltransferase
MMPPVPPGWRLRPDRSLRTARGGAVLVGGSPLRVLRLSRRGAETVAAWWAGAPVGASTAERALARRLLDAGIAHPDPPRAASPAEVTVVVPVRDRVAELRRCLGALDPRCRVVVVDDGSTDAAGIAAVAADAGAELVRLPAPRGPSAARNAGLDAARTPFVAFVDSDCVVGPGFPGRLVDHLRDPALAVAAPRICPLDPHARGLLARYENAHSALDMGPREGLVRPESPVPYVPSAALVARTAAIAAHRFDETLRTAEDVDLIWRLHDAGWQVRYDPAVRVAHDHRTGLGAWFRRRVVYNASTAVLMRRHPGRVPAVSLSRAGAAFWLAVAAGRPRLAAAVAGGASILLARRLAPQVPRAWPIAARLVADGLAHEARHLGRALTGPWLPLLAAASSRRRLRRRAWAIVLAGVAAEWAGDGLRPSPGLYALGRPLEDLARGLGVWLGCARERHLGALLPRVRGLDRATTSPSIPRRAPSAPTPTA